MAIVEMKRLTLLAVRQDEKKLLRAMQHMGCVDISRMDEEELQPFASEPAADEAETEQLLNRLTWTIGQMSSYNRQKAPFMGNIPEAPKADTDWVEQHPDEMRAMLEAAEELERRAGEDKGRLARLQTAADALTPWLELDIPAEKLTDSKLVCQFTGTVENRGLGALEAGLSELPVTMNVVNTVRETTCIWLAAHQSVRGEVQSLLRDAGFTPVRFQEGEGTPRQQRAKLEQEMAEVRADQEGIRQEWQQLSENLTRCKIWYDMLGIERQRQLARDRAVGTKDVFLMKGWVPAEQAEAVAEKLRSLSETASVTVEDPQEGEEPPVALRNNRVVTPFENVVEGFAMPQYRSMDPTAAMAPFYALLFGMMLSDAGYGLVMAIAIPLLIWLKQPGKNSRKLLGLLFFSAIATVLCGAVYDTWFGFNPMKDLLHMKPILDPINDPMPTMIVCLGVGVIHLFAGLGCGAYQNIKRGKPLDAVFDQLSWVLVISGAIMLLGGGLIAEIGKWMAIAGVALIILFAGREKKNPFSRLIGGLGALYGATSWISDILSYMRLFGMGLATGVIGMVINMLVGMVFQNGIIGIILGSVVFVGAHLFNLGINALGAYVHSCRLQYIEFFGKFYEEGGVPFRPLQYNTRYVRFGTAD